MLPQVIQSPVTYPILDLAYPQIPQRSRFYPLHPIGIGTAYVESLISYTCRLTAAHSISFGSFYEYLIVPSLNKRYLMSPSKVGPATTLIGSFRERMRSINGIGKMAREWIELLEALTLRNDLRFLSLIALSDVTPHWKLLRAFQAWCPVCYEEMLQPKQVIYQPLLWAIAAVEICPRHRLPLVERCPYCHKQLLPLTRRAQIGYCPRCGHWLGDRYDSRITVDTKLVDEGLAWKLFVASSIGDLLAASPNISIPLTKEAFVESLHECVLRSTGGVINQFAKLIRKHLMTVYGWYRGKVKIPLSDLPKICYCLDLSITDFVNGADVVRKSRVTVRELPNGAYVVSKRRTPKPFDYEKFEAELTKFLDIVPPISMAEAGRRVGIDHRGLYRKFPELCRKISLSYRKYLQDLYRTQRSKLEEEVRQAVIHLYSQGIYVSPRRVAEYLNKPSYIGRRDVAAIVRETREMLDTERGS